MRRLKRKKFSASKKGSSDVSLNITAMADVFTIILVFLVKSFSSGSLNLSPSAEMNLPSANGDLPKKEALQVDISRDRIMIGGEQVVTLDQFQFGPGSLRNGVALGIVKAAKKEKMKQEIDSERVFIFSDKGAPYGTVKTVLKSMSLSGYSGFRLAVVK